MTTKKCEILSIVNSINANKKMRQVHLNYERVDNFHHIRLYTGETCIQTMFSGSAKDVIDMLYAFRSGLKFDSSIFVK